MEDIKVNKNGVNACIKAMILPEAKMREIGFTDHCKDRWYFCRMLKSGSELSFNVAIPKNGDDIRIDILDEDFCQPYDYQYMLERNPKFHVALAVREEVEYWMDYLQRMGVLSGHEKYAYI